MIGKARVHHSVPSESGDNIYYSLVSKYLLVRLAINPFSCHFVWHMYIADITLSSWARIPGRRSTAYLIHDALAWILNYTLAGLLKDGI